MSHFYVILSIASYSLCLVPHSVLSPPNLPMKFHTRILNKEIWISDQLWHHQVFSSSLYKTILSLRWATDCKANGLYNPLVGTTI